MLYRSVVPAVFLSRPNRFIAVCRVNGTEVRVHVKNTGRCRELLRPGAEVWLEPAEGPRKTAFSLIAVQKGERLVNIDSQAPNKVAEEALREGRLCLPEIGCPELVAREKTFGSSRFDFYLEGNGRQGYLEVKGVTLEENGVCRFPDAPTERGARHLRELILAREQGYAAAVLFVIQMEGVRYLVPNDGTDPAFGAALREAAAAGVAVLARECAVKPESMVLGQEVPVFPCGAPCQTSGSPLW